ncbi:MAG: S-layer homology domain-containing protein [Candidatus Saccharimonadales bacterium]
MKRLLVLLLTLSMVIGISVPAFAANASGYTDVPDTHWAADSIKACTTKKIMQGIGNNQFAPESTLTRAQVAQICYNAYQNQLPSTTAKTIVDAPKGEWYHDAVYWMVANDIINGTAKDDGIYCYPNATADRKYVALVLYRLANKLGATLPQVNEAIVFPDIGELGTEYQKAIGALQQAGVISGFPDGTYRPNDSLTRAQAAKLFDIYTNIEGLGLTAIGDPAVVPTPGSEDFLSNKICQEVREYALSVGFSSVEDYTDSAGGWQINIRNASTGNCKTLGLRLGAGYDYWRYTVVTYTSYQVSVESGEIYNMEDLKALILKCSNY